MNKIIFAIAVLSLAAVAQIRAGDMTGAKKIFTEKQDSVIWLTGVVKISVSASGSGDDVPNIPDEEAKVMALGTIVSSEGLVVAMLSELDPVAGVKNKVVQTENGPIKLNATAVIKELKAVMPDGTEIPAELAMKDVNLDLAVIRIKTSSKEANGMVLHAIDLKANATGLILDEVVTLSRMPEIFNRVPAVGPGHICMITKKPRVFILATGAVGGCPTFTMDGKLLGITAGRTKEGEVVDEAIIPAADVLDVVEQSKNQKTAPADKSAKEEKPAKEAKAAAEDKEKGKDKQP